MPLIMPAHAAGSDTPAGGLLQVGEHFSKWGEVMDVVVVKDCGPLLALAGKATALERKRRAARNMVERHMAREQSNLPRV
jgi:hypothetical protein